LYDEFQRSSLHSIFGMDKQRKNEALLIAACIVAAIRLRGEPIRPAPKLTATISDSMQFGAASAARIAAMKSSGWANQPLSKATDRLRSLFALH
jgi:hypothetical protein